MPGRRLTLFGVFDDLRLADDVDLDLAGIFQLRLDLLRQLTGEDDHVVLGDILEEAWCL